MTTVASAVAVATSDEAFFDRVSRAVAGLTPPGTTESVPHHLEGIPEPGSERHAATATAAALIIDEKWPDGSGLEVISRSDSLQTVSSSFAKSDPIPAIELIRRVTDPSGSTSGSAKPIVIVCSEAPTLAFTQVALANGVDWVWSNRTEFNKLQPVIARLHELKSAQSSPKPNKPKVLVVENAHEVIKALNTWLGDEFDLSAVNVDIRPANEFYVTPNEAMDHFRANGPFSAAIVDLALTDDEEDKAEVELGTEEAALLSFLGGNSDLGRYLKGILFVKQLLRADENIVIIVFSSYLKNVVTLDLIKTYLGQLTTNVSFFSKELNGYRQLHELLVSRFLRETD